MWVVKRGFSLVESLVAGRVTEASGATEASDVLAEMGEFVRVCVRVKVLELNSVDASTVKVSSTVMVSVVVWKMTLGAAHELLVGKGVMNAGGTSVMVWV
jgi:hypothetical protein